MPRAPKKGASLNVSRALVRKKCATSRRPAAATITLLLL